MNANIGTEAEWEPIFKRNPGLREALNELIELTGECGAQVRLLSPAHTVIFVLRNVCMEECWEVLLLAGNAYVSGAAKIIRALYERALTICYIAQNPDKAQRFLDYGAIQEHRTLGPALALFGEEGLQEKLQPTSVAEIKADYERVKPMFQIANCGQCKDKCTHKRLAPSWDVDLSTMAKRVGMGFEELMLPAYTLPTLEMHSTRSGAFSRTKTTEQGVAYDFGLPADRVDVYIILALQLMLIVHKVTAIFLHVPFGPRLLQFEKAFQLFGAQHPSNRPDSRPKQSHTASEPPRAHDQDQPTNSD
jgi:hypothetical protein